MDYFIKLYKKKKGKDIRSSNRAIQKLRREVEKAKRALSSQHQARIEIESFFEGDDFSETLTRAKFEELNMVSPVYYYELLFCSLLLHSVLLLCLPYSGRQWCYVHLSICLFVLAYGHAVRCIL